MTEVETGSLLDRIATRDVYQEGIARLCADAPPGRCDRNDPEWARDLPAPAGGRT